MVARDVSQLCAAGTSTSQPDGVEHVLVTGGSGVPTSALILGA